MKYLIIFLIAVSTGLAYRSDQAKGDTLNITLMVPAHTDTVHDTIIVETIKSEIDTIKDTVKLDGKYKASVRTLGDMIFIRLGK